MCRPVASEMAQWTPGLAQPICTTRRQRIGRRQVGIFVVPIRPTPQNAARAVPRWGVRSVRRQPSVAVPLR